MTVIYAEPFGVTAAGGTVTCYTMKNGSGMTVRVLDYGATIQSVFVPGRDGKPVDVALGYDDIAGYEAGSCWMGSFVGRYANRIKNARFVLNGTTYELTKNAGPNHLHGTFERRIFAGTVEKDRLVLRYTSPDGEDGFPGTLAVTVTFSLRDDNTLALDVRAVTDADTVVNLISHTYFNLAGQGTGDVLAHRLTVPASRFAEADANTAPTGRLLPVEGTAMDFRAEKAVGRDLFAAETQLVQARGYDHSFALDKRPGVFGLAASAYAPATGIALELWTSQPALQVYSGNFVDEDAAPRGKDGARYPRYGGLALEAQRHPDSPNQPDFPSSVLRAGGEYHELTEYRFRVR